MLMNNHIFTAFSDPNRRRMLDILKHGKRTAGDLSSSFDISGSAVSQHLKVLLQARLVGVEKRKNSRIYYLRKEGFEDLQQYLGQFWDDHLTVLKQLAEAEEREKEQ
ncbi:putative transcriptional regulator [Paenibacillus agaridevorans]|uniref:Putative transcriptional regulator n=2 Tax=Paenibacillus agaridevorans TaxID=171404 RepID=A0A2R5EIL9_9BACL|nr:putative transcriptional regulator [Paenibacillus agaridevorans]